MNPTGCMWLVSCVPSSEGAQSTAFRRGRDLAPSQWDVGFHPGFLEVAGCRPADVTSTGVQGDSASGPLDAPAASPQNISGATGSTNGDGLDVHDLIEQTTDSAVSRTDAASSS